MIKILLFALILSLGSSWIPVYPGTLTGDDLMGVWWVQLFINSSSTIEYACSTITYYPGNSDCPTCMAVEYYTQGFNEAYYFHQEDMICRTAWNHCTLYDTNTSRIVGYYSQSPEWMIWADDPGNIWVATRNQLPPNNTIIQYALKLLSSYNIVPNQYSLNYINNTLCNPDM